LTDRITVRSLVSHKTRQEVGVPVSLLMQLRLDGRLTGIRVVFHSRLALAAAVGDPFAA